MESSRDKIDILEIEDRLWDACCQGNIKNVSNVLDDLMATIGTTNHADIYDQIEYGFIVSCREGHMKLAKWFLSTEKLTELKIDINRSNDIAFCWACSAGQLHIAKWLMTLTEKGYGRIDIHTQQNHAIHMACMNRHPDVVKWLASMP